MSIVIDTATQGTLALERLFDGAVRFSKDSGVVQSLRHPEVTQFFAAVKAGGVTIEKLFDGSLKYTQDGVSRVLRALDHSDLVAALLANPAASGTFTVVAALIAKTAEQTRVGTFVNDAAVQALVGTVATDATLVTALAALLATSTVGATASTTVLDVTDEPTANLTAVWSTIPQTAQEQWDALQASLTGGGYTLEQYLEAVDAQVRGLYPDDTAELTGLLYVINGVQFQLPEGSPVGSVSTDTHVSIPYSLILSYA